MAIVLFTPPYAEFQDDNGNPLNGGKVYTYLAGTLTPQATYTDQGGLTANANPVVLDSSGRASIWLDNSVSYKFVVKTSADVTIRTVDNVTPFNSSTGLAVLGNIAANTIVGNNTGSSTTPLALTVTQAKTMLGIGKPTIQNFTSSGTYTPTSGMSYCLMRVWGGGGGGGGSSGGGGGGGGAGGYSEEWVLAATVGASQTVTIGAGGTAGASAGGTGGTGGTTSVGSILQATGGLGGVGGTSATGGFLGGDGGVGSGGDLNLTGAPGGVATYAAFTSGFGGATTLGGNGRGKTLPSAANGSAAGESAVANSGSGGGGAYNNSSTNQAGGAGGSGFVQIIEWL